MSRIEMGVSEMIVRCVVFFVFLFGGEGVTFYYPLFPILGGESLQMMDVIYDLTDAYLD